MAKVAATSLTLEEGKFNAGDPLPESALKNLDKDLAVDEGKFVDLHEAPESVANEDNAVLEAGLVKANAKIVALENRIRELELAAIDPKSAANA